MKIGISPQALLFASASVGILLLGAVAVAAIVSGAVTTNSSIRVTVTQLKLDKPASISAGDVMLANIGINGGSSAVVSTVPSGWTQITRTDNDVNIALISYWKVASSSEPSDYTWSVDGQTTAEGGIIAYRGVDTTNPVDSMAGNTGFGTQATTSAITTNAANEQIVALFATDVGKNPNAGAYFSTSTGGMTEKYDVSNVPFGPSIAADDVIQTSAGGTGSKLSTISGNKARNWATQQIALRQPASSTIMFDNRSASVGGTNPSVSITRGTSGSNYIGLVFLAAGNTDISASDCTWGGNSMTLLMDQLGSSSAHNQWFYLLAPPSGSQIVSCTTNGNMQLAAVTYFGVSQSDPFDTNFDGASHSYVVNVDGAVANGAELTTTGTTHVDTSYAVLGVNYQNDITSGTNATERVSKIVFDRGLVTSTAGAVSIGILNNSGATEGIDGFMLALQPAN